MTRGRKRKNKKRKIKRTKAERKEGKSSFDSLANFSSSSIHDCLYKLQHYPSNIPIHPLKRKGSVLLPPQLANIHIVLTYTVNPLKLLSLYPSLSPFTKSFLRTDFITLNFLKLYKRRLAFHPLRPMPRSSLYSLIPLPRTMSNHGVSILAILMISVVTHHQWPRRTNKCKLCYRILYSM